MPQGTNGVKEFVPVARISDMLLGPGQAFEYNGRTLRYPEIKLVYWAGGNPFHHHQDLNRLSRAFAVPEIIVVHESAWTAMARSADIVLPATMTLERDDIGATTTDPLLIAMRKLAFATIRRPIRCRLPAGRSRFFRKPSPASATTTAPGIQHGCRRPNNRQQPIR